MIVVLSISAEWRSLQNIFVTSANFFCCCAVYEIFSLCFLTPFFITLFISWSFFMSVELKRIIQGQILKQFWRTNVYQVHVKNWKVSEGLTAFSNFFRWWFLIKKIENKTKIQKVTTHHKWFLLFLSFSPFYNNLPHLTFCYEIHHLLSISPRKRVFKIWPFSISFSSIS